jgi:hypothetical protein
MSFFGLFGSFGFLWFFDQEEEKGTGYFSGDVRGRPRGRSVESRPKVVAIVACQLAVPKGCCRFTQVRRAVSA